MSYKDIPDSWQELTGHTSPETAYLIDDYPYGFRLRTSIRYWVETKKGQGQRVMSQTRDPKRAGNPWNKPKGSTYAPIKVLLLDPSNGHVENVGLSVYAEEPEIVAFQARFPGSCSEERNARVIRTLIAQQRAFKRVTVTVLSGAEADGQPRQTLQEQQQIIRGLTVEELARMRREGSSEPEGGAQ